ncbi:elongation factor G [Candidatus Carsonella ruddii PV]|uniref:Elongation factor G n=2 Tax=Carsonella ruddii TaxID=114186 RepID=EFG_CARRP|nr:elongation factor G [Candidatus Carsonella ruddii]Q05FI2.1 RecName: Full=Elongation factor G; Short=EF-G [Candidatus Carsonella ruddii PV]AAK17079.1 elongation factor G [Candidatus Carsonella ruddii]BAF35189.1 elongation factor G [Candidatus Carsonella ruddii PV]
MNDIKNIRNIGIIAHVDAGKTTTTERILFFSGFSHKIGEVHTGNTITDWMKQEQERGITITSASVTFFWKTNFYNSSINLIDTPGHVDFTIEVERSLRVLDGAVILICASSGIQPQTETVWNQSEKFNIPKILFVNKLDRIGAKYLSIIENIKKKFFCNILIINLNIGIENSFSGIIDLINMKELIWNNSQLEIRNITNKNFDISNKYRNILLETLSEYDDIFLEKYINSNFSIKDIIESIRKLVILNKIIPIACGSSLKNKGIEFLLDSIVNFLPSPIDIGIKNVSNINYSVNIKSKFLALLFKVFNDPYLGLLSFIRIYSGKIEPGQIIFNNSKNIKEKIFRIIRMFANSKKDLNIASAGDIVVLIGLKNSFTGDTLSFDNEKVLLEKINIPLPVISVSVEPIVKNDYEKLLNLINKFCKEDPSLLFKINENTGELILSGMGELHLEIIIDRINNEFNIKTKTSKPQVSYKESIKKTIIQEGKYIKQTGGRGQYGHVVLKIEPILIEKDDFIFKIEVVGGVIPKEYFLSIEKGILEQIKCGVVLGYPVTKIKITLINGSFHPVDSSEYAFKNAASIALKEALKKANSFLLEPIMKVEIISPKEYLGIVISDISKKRGNIISVVDNNNNLKIINSLIPLRELFGYSTDLRSNTKGRANYNMEFHNYSETPNYILEKIKKK